MDIANRVGLNAPPQKRKNKIGFSVAIAGLTDNPTHGPNAMRGVPLIAEVTANPAAWIAPQDMTYQWHSVAGGPIAGASAAGFTPGAALPDLDGLFCEVTVPGQGTRASAQAVLREVPPGLLGSLHDEIFDLDAGLQRVAGAGAFSGLNLRFAVNGAGASVDPVTGEISIPTQTEVDGAVITLTATNSGGMASTGFQVTIEDLAVVEGALPFGALTPAGAGGVPVQATSIVSGDAMGHWQITDGMLAPSAAGAGALDGVYPLIFDSGDMLDVMIERDKASARPDEIAAVFETLPETARGLLVQDGDARALGRQRLSPRVFLSEMVLEPVNWVEDADPRQSYRPVTLGGLNIGGDSSGDAILRMENLTVQGFVTQMEQGPSESESNNGIILVERPSRHVTIRQNEIWSRTMADIVAADDYRDNVKTSRQLRGIATKVYAGTNEHIRIEDNHVHDVSRGMSMVDTSSYQGVRSRLCGNIIEDVYTNFFTAGYLNGLDIFDNLCMGAYAALDDTLGSIPATSPHSSVGGSFDAGGSRSTQNVTMMGNLLHTGWKRTKLHEDMGLFKPRIGATGIKFNDPVAADSYWNLVVAFNTVVSHGICMEMTGAGADDHLMVFNNTLASEGYAGIGSGPVYYFTGADNVRMFNNIGTDYTIGNLDYTGMFSRTLDTLQGYGNIKINTGKSNVFGETSYFTDHPGKAMELLTIDEARAAYVPKAGTSAMVAVQKKGAMGTGLYAGNGVHGVSYDKPVATGGVDDILPLTTWGGNAYMSYAGSGAMNNLGTRRSAMLFAWEGRFDPSVANAEVALFALKDGRITINRSAGGSLAVTAMNVNTGALCRAYSSFRINPEDGLVRIAISYDVDTGRVTFVRNGVLDDFQTIQELGADVLHVGSNPVVVHADHFSTAGKRFAGQFGRLYWTPDFVDLESEAGLNRLFTQSGAFRSFGQDGSAVTGAPATIYLHGSAATLANHGNGGAFKLSGSVTD